MKVVLYIRVSTLDQSPEAQRRELEAYARRHDWPIVGVFEDSGADLKRPAMTELLEAARGGKVECVLCWKLDRFGRSLLDCLDKLQVLETERVRFIAVTQGIDTGDGYANPTARFFLHVLAAAAEFERSLIREQSAAGMKRYRQDLTAGHIGKTVHSKSGKDLAPHRPRVILDLERIRTLRSQGMSIRIIAQQLRTSSATIVRRLRER